MPLHIDELVDQNNESGLTISLRRERNKLTSLGSLPSELVIMICEHILDPAKPRIIASLIHICSYIYYTALSALRLWTSLHWMQNSGWRCLSIARAKGLPLNVDWKGYEPAEDDESYDDSWIDDVFSAASSAIANITTPSSPAECLCASSPYAVVGDRWVERLLDCNFLLPHNPLGGHMQCLNVLELVNLDLSRERGDTFSHWHCPALKELALLGVHGHRVDFYHIIRAMPHLDVFQMEDSRIIDSTF